MKDNQPNLEPQLGKPRRTIETTLYLSITSRAFLEDEFFRRKALGDRKTTRAKIVEDALQLLEEKGPRDVHQNRKAPESTSKDN